MKVTFETFSRVFLSLTAAVQLENCFGLRLQIFYQVVIAQWLARQFATGEVPGSNSGKGEN